MIATLRLSFLAASAGVALCFAAPVQAADLYPPTRGSIKDFSYAPPRPAAGPCYVRADVGYSVSAEPDVSWEVNSITEVGGVRTYTYQGDDVDNVAMDDSWFGEVGIGCSRGSRGFRGEFVLGFRSERDIKGEPQDFTFNATDVDDPLHTSIDTYTLMFNLYYDLGKFGRFVPYIGVGAGVAYHDMSEVYFTQNPFLTNRIRGNSDLTFAWSLMVGTAYQLSDRAILDVGYRYFDFGRIQSASVDDAFYYNPPVKIDEIVGHEFKVGIRYHFGTTHASYQPPGK
ncbi:MAG: outer membrane beta-barrel protein [Pseudomonadota bacterium]